MVTLQSYTVINLAIQMHSATAQISYYRLILGDLNIGISKAPSHSPLGVAIFL